MAKNGTVAYVSELPDCDFCKQGGKTRKAKYDFRTSWGPWANGCEMHWRTNRMHSGLGIGYGQELKVGSEPERDRRQEVMAAIDAGDFDALEDAIGDGDIAEWL